MKTSRRFKLAALLPVLMVLAAGCSRNPPEKIEKIVLGAETVPHSSPVWIAENKGYFREQGLNVEIKEFESGRTALRSMLNAEGIDIVTAAQTPVVFNSFSRNDFAIVGGMVYSENDIKMLARQDRGISAPADLKGKTVGMTAGSSGHFFLGLFAAYYQMRASDVRTMDMEPAHLSQALIEGQVDAIATWEPHIYKTKQKLGDKAFLLSSGGIYRDDFYFVARKEFIDNHSRTLKRFLRAIEKAEEFIDHTITVESADEIGELSQAFNQMTASLKEVTVSKSDLEREMVERKKAEEALRKAHDELEMRIQERTAELARANEELRHLSSRRMTAQEDERKRIASDLHDTIGSCLVGVKYKVESALQQIKKTPETATESLDSIIPRIHEAIDECRRIQLDLRPSMIDDLGLLPTLSWFCRTFEQTYPGIRVEQKIEIAEGDIPDPLKIVVFRVTQEAMNNMAKHSKADQVRFSLRKVDDRMELVLQDNGRGFSLEEIHSRRATVKGLGLTNMRERAGLSGGSFDIESVDGKGTTVTVSWPFCRNG